MLIASAHAILAIAFHRQGDAKAAREHQVQAAKLLNQYLPHPDRFPTQGDAGYDHDWLVAWLLNREAWALIQGDEVEAKK